jgi:stage V sporulation protein B
MKKDSFFKNSLILTLSNLFTGTLGFMFSIILSRELGAEGMGLYGLIMPIYNLFICLICGGVITAISKVSAEFFAAKDFKSLHKCIKTTLFFNIFWSVIVISIVFIFASFISTYIIKDPRTVYALRVTCPAMVFIALSNTLKGYFYGTSNMAVPAFIDIFEKAVRIVIISLLMRMLTLNDVASTVTVAYSALCVGEFISLLLLYGYYRYDKRKTLYSSQKSEGRAQLIFNVLVISLPLCINGFVSTALATASALIVPRQLVKAGFEYSTALSMIGKFTGMSLSIVFFPIIVIGSISTVLIPDLSQNMSKKDYYAVEKRIGTVIKLSFLIGLATMIICICIPDALGYLFFKRNDLGNYIKFAALSAPIYYVAATTYGILNGLGRQKIILRNSLIISAAEVVLLYIFTAIPNINIFGYGITMLSTAAITLIVNFAEIKKYCDIDFSPVKLIIDILVAVLVYFILSTANKLMPVSLSTFKNVSIILLGFSLFFFTHILIEKRTD